MRQKFGLYEPSGGSAPDIAGKGIAQSDRNHSFRCNDAALSVLIWIREADAMEAGSEQRF
ncbi:MAG: hypothetical protein ACLUUO_06370 [Sellimonas intestinalis]